MNYIYFYPTVFASEICRYSPNEDRKQTSDVRRLASKRRAWCWRGSPGARDRWLIAKCFFPRRFMRC